MLCRAPGSFRRFFIKCQVSRACRNDTERDHINEQDMDRMLSLEATWNFTAFAALVPESIVSGVNVRYSPVTFALFFSDSFKVSANNKVDKSVLTAR